MDKREKGDSVLRQLRTQELEKLLVQDFSTFDGSEPDTEWIMAVMEVMQERGTAEFVDTDTAWERFQRDYQPFADSFVSENFVVPDEPTLTPGLGKRPTSKPDKTRRIFRLAGIAAILIVVLTSVAVAFGFDVFQAIGSWNDDVFSFVDPGTVQTQQPTQALPENDPCADLRKIVAEQTSLLLLPTWFPEGTVEDKDIGIFVGEEDGTKVIHSLFSSGQGSFSLKVRIYDKTPNNYKTSYKKDVTSVETYEVNGIDHYIVKNLNKYRIIWTNENAEVSIQGDLLLEELKKMVASIYER